MKRFFTNVYDFLTGAVYHRRRKDYVRRMEQLFAARIVTTMVRSKDLPLRIYLSIDDVLIYEIQDVLDTGKGIIHVNEVGRFIDMLHERWLISKQYTKEEIDKYCNK